MGQTLSTGSWSRQSGKRSMRTAGGRESKGDRRSWRPPGQALPTPHSLMRMTHTRLRVSWSPHSTQQLSKWAPLPFLARRKHLGEMGTFKAHKYASTCLLQFTALSLRKLSTALCWFASHEFGMVQRKNKTRACQHSLLETWKTHSHTHTCTPSQTWASKNHETMWWRT